MILRIQLYFPFFFWIWLLLILVVLYIGPRQMSTLLKGVSIPVFIHACKCAFLIEYVHLVYESFEFSFYFSFFPMSQVQDSRMNLKNELDTLHR